VSDLTCFKAYDVRGEMSAHHYFRDFAYCDSGMIPWLLIAELVSHSERSLGDWVKDRFAAFPSSGEMNFKVADAGKTIENVLSAHRAAANRRNRRREPGI
jgi:phosphomannomutase